MLCDTLAQLTTLFWLDFLCNPYKYVGKLPEIILVSSLFIGIVNEHFIGWRRIANTLFKLGSSKDYGHEMQNCLMQCAVARLHWHQPRVQSIGMTQNLTSKHRF